MKQTDDDQLREYKAWLGLDDKKRQQRGPLLPRDYPLVAQVFLHVGEMLLAITLADLFLGTLPKFLQAFAAYILAGI